MSLAAASAARPGRAARLLRALADLAVGTILCLGPVTSLVALGWLTRRMAAGISDDPRPRWVLGAPGKGALRRALGGLAMNVRAGVTASAGLAALTLPFSALWLFAWWAGWENSFNKGYEQAWVGPVTGLGASLLAAVTLAFLPMALAHHAATGRFGAFFEWRVIRHRTLAAAWRGPALALLSVLLCLPLLAARALPVFVGEFLPGFAERPPEAQAEVARAVALAAAAWSFLALLWMRGAAARIYRASEARKARGPAIAWIALSALIWFGLVVQIFVGQFMNHAWTLWLTHPAFLLPWPG